MATETETVLMMMMRSTWLLAVVAVALVAGVILVNTTDDEYSTAESQALLPDLRSAINNIDQVAVQYGDETVTIERQGERWSAREKAGYRADTGTLRQVLLALADASKLEQKTANPDMHDRLGLRAPENGDGVGIRIAGEGVEHALILGNVAQENYRYVRFAGDDQTWLIDQNPELPDDAGGWLDAQVINIPPADVQSVSIEHADGEAIRFSKASRDEGSFSVADIPADRELTYPGVVNGIAGVLRDLTLDDVQTQPDDLPAPGTTTSFTTFDGLAVTVQRFPVDSADWFSITASVTKPPEGDDTTAPPDDAASEPAGDSGTGEPASNTAEPADGGETGNEPSALAAEPPENQAAAINARTGGWLYRLPDSKGNLLQRRWDDILKEPDEEE
ncbi:MAG: DUF4340 domain-containing protein [Woeseia sp.]